MDKDLRADIKKCEFNKRTWAEAGFHIDPVRGRGKVASMVVLREHLMPDALAIVDSRNLPADCYVDNSCIIILLKIAGNSCDLSRRISINLEILS